MAATLANEDLITVVSAALLTILRRDMSLNRRLYAWLLGAHDTQPYMSKLRYLVLLKTPLFKYYFLGADIKGGMVAPHPSLSTTVEDHSSFYFNTYSKDLLVKVAPRFYGTRDD